MATLGQQLRANAIAILSLTIALSSFSYTAWRTERSEANRTTRQAAFQMLVALGQMQEVVYRAHYDHDAVHGSPRSGWVYVQTINDFSATLPAPVPARAQSLLESWRDHWEGLGTQESDAVAIDDALGACRVAVVEAIRALQ
jgi:hypothetical protein